MKREGWEAYEAAARRRLERLELDGERRNFLCVAQLIRDGRAEHAQAVRELDWALERGAPEAPLRALKGRAMAFLGFLGEARNELDRSLLLEPADGRVRAWRAECALLEGSPSEALRHLEEARRLAPEHRWTPILSAAALLASGDEPGALAELDRTAPCDAAKVLRALALARSASAREGVRILSGSLDAKWPLAFRGMLKLEAGDADGAEADISAAYAAESLDWILELRCRARERAGRMAEATADATALVRLNPRSAAARARRAALHACRRRHAAALADLGAAIRLAPSEPLWLLRRAETYITLGRLEEAERDLAAIPGADLPAATERLALVRAVLGHKQGKAGLDDSACSFWEGFALLREGRPDRAARLFDQAAVSAPKSEPGRARRARFYALTARVRSQPPAPSPAREKGPELRICGLGLFPPYTVGAETVAALAGCDVVFNNVAGPETAEWLWSLGPRCLPATYDAVGDEPRWADRIFAELDRGRTVAFATRGHPQLLGKLAFELLARARRLGIRHRAWSGLSCLDSLPCAVAGRPDAGEELQAFDCSALESGAELAPSLPALVFFYEGAERERLRRLGGLLARWRGADAPLLVFGPKYDEPARPCSPSALSASEEGWHSSLVLYVPADASARRQASASLQPGQSLSAVSASAAASARRSRPAKARDLASLNEAE
jgi:tetratricopeptide (TPR) repeat protein